MKNKIYLSLLSAILLMGVSFNAHATDADVDKPVQYGEKYFCTITTTDAKNYTLDLEWQAEPAKSKTPAWEKKLIYTLRQDLVIVDTGYFSDPSFGRNKTELTFNYDKYIFAGSYTQPTRVGGNYGEAKIELAKNYDKDAKVFFKVVSFSSFDSSTRYLYGLVDEIKISETETVLSIQDSNCTVTTEVKQ